MPDKDGTKAIPLDEDRYITEADAAALLGYSPHTLKMWRQLGTSPFTFNKLRRKVLYQRREILACLEAYKVSNNVQADALAARATCAANPSLVDLPESSRPDDWPMQVAIEALRTLPDTIDGIESWRHVQSLEVEAGERGSVRIKGMKLRDAPISEDLIREVLAGLNTANPNGIDTGQS